METDCEDTQNYRQKGCQENFESNFFPKGDQLCPNPSSDAHPASTQASPGTGAELPPSQTWGSSFLIPDALQKPDFWLFCDKMMSSSS